MSLARKMNRAAKRRRFAAGAKVINDTALRIHAPEGTVDAFDKGLFGGSCNRSACQRPGAEWYNHGTRKYYCEPCAYWLNNDPVNRREAARLYGHSLCTKGQDHA